MQLYQALQDRPINLISLTAREPYVDEWASLEILFPYNIAGFILNYIEIKASYLSMNVFL